jgi:hypothetical protein
MTSAVSGTRSPAELQQRGYQLELLIADLFEACDMEYRRPYKALHEQIDGSFNFRGFTYLVEAKWEKHPATFDDMGKFKLKVDGKLESVRGLFIAMAGYDDAWAMCGYLVTAHQQALYADGRDRNGTAVPSVSRWPRTPNATPGLPTTGSPTTGSEAGAERDVHSTALPTVGPGTPDATGSITSAAGRGPARPPQFGSAGAENDDSRAWRRHLTPSG